MDKQTLHDTFKNMCAGHDLTFAYSDDSSCYRRGQKRWDEINAFMDKHPEHELMLIQIWNDVVDRKIAEGYRESFYKKPSSG